MLEKILSSKIERGQILKLVSTQINDTNIEDVLLLKAALINRNLFKRTADIMIALFLIIFIFSWLFPIIAIVIKVSSKGSIFFFQKREGINRKVFDCIKFRTMFSNSEDIDANGKYQQATYNDRRITKAGAFLRKTSIDELPQIFNVLKGDMSIVGPRPHPIPLNRESEKVIVGYNLRHLVKPGITGLAQVNGFRGETKEIMLMKKRVENDIKYIKEWGKFSDVLISFKTAKNILFKKNDAF